MPRVKLACQVLVPRHDWSFHSGDLRGTQMDDGTWKKSLLKAMDTMTAAAMGMIIALSAYAITKVCV